MAKLDLGVLVSGTGTNLQAVLDAVQAGELDADVRLVVSNREDAFALERARKSEVKTAVISHRQYPSRVEFDRALIDAFTQAGASTIVLAGFMRVLTPTFLDAFPSRVINIHPALLPAFPGVHAQNQALQHGVKIAGCTVHFVDSGTDTGPIIAQAVVPVRDDDTEQTLASRILECEHVLLVRAIRWLGEGRLEIVRSEGSRSRVVTHGVHAALRRAGQEL